MVEIDLVVEGSTVLLEATWEIEVEVEAADRLEAPHHLNKIDVDLLEKIDLTKDITMEIQAQAEVVSSLAGTMMSLMIAAAEAEAEVSPPSSPLVTDKEAAWIEMTEVLVVISRRPWRIPRQSW